MKEITRIHIAKVAYDIELDAKKDIEQYMAALERYASDQEILEDIEIRVTELLAERGVQAGGVIASGDVAAVRAQLGEPSDFTSAEIEAGIEGAPNDIDQQRRVYRDEDEAVLGGVLAGFAKYFGIDPLWVRLIFLVILLGSFGTAIVVYVILWLIIPPARTAADKLRMSGKPVTLESIKKLVRSEERVGGEKSQAVKRVVSATGGWLLVLAAIGGLIAVAAVVSSLIFGFTPYDVMYMNDSWWFMSGMGLAVLSGLLFSALCFVLASAAFRRAWTSRLSTATGIIIVAGLMAFAGAVGFGMYGFADEQARIASLMETRRVEQVSTIAGVKNLKIETSDGVAAPANIEYIVSDSQRIEVTGLPGIEPVISVSDDESTMTVKMTVFERERQIILGYYAKATLKVYGPSLESIELSDLEQSVSYQNNALQDTLRVTGKAGSFRLAGTYKSVRVDSRNTAAIALGDAAIEQLEVVLSGGSVTAGVVRTLSVEQSDVCPAREYHDERGSLQVQAVSSDTMLYNGKEQAVDSKRTECGAIIIGDDNPEVDFGDEL